VQKTLRGLRVTAPSAGELPGGARDHEIPLNPRWVPEWATNGPRDAQKSAPGHPMSPKWPPKGSQSSLSRAESVTFRRQIGESGPLLKHKQGLCFLHIMRVRAPPFFLLNSPRERTALRERSFAHSWLHFRRPRGIQGRPKGAQRSRKEPQRLPGDT